jgi:membrane associated rhomboid family serine protease
MIVVGTMVPLPPDLSRLGDELTAAAVRALDERRRRRRMLARCCACAIAGLLTLAFLAPAALSPGRSGAILATEGVLIRLPERPPVLLARAPADTLLVRLPDRRPIVPSVIPQRDA